MLVQEMNKFECKRCGLCCLTVGRTFWKNGDYKKIPELSKLAHNGDYEDGGLPCEMLSFEKGLAICLIEKKYGRKAKPDVCREYPEDGKKCFRQKEEMIPSAKP